MSNINNLYSSTGGEYSKIDVFLDDYETVYYYESGYIAEDRIEAILKNGIQSRKDAFDVLAWKLGGINKNKTNANKGAIPNEIIKYNSDKWFFDKNIGQEKRSQGTSRRGPIDFNENGQDYLERFEGKGEIGKRLKELKEKFDANEKSDKAKEKKKHDADDIAAEMLNLLAERVPKGIGPVYLITLLYFLTQGKRYPIYDQFAHAALEVIFAESEIALGSEINKNTISNDKTSRNFGKNVISGKNSVYAKYMELIKKFEKEFDIIYYANNESTNRKADRALWAYGHMFNLV